MSWSEKIGRLRGRELPTVEVTIALDKGAEKRLHEAEAALKAATDRAWGEHDTQEQVDNTPEVVAARETLAKAENDLKAASLVMRFKTLPADVMETLRGEVFTQTEDEDERVERLASRVMAASYIPEDGDDLTVEDVENLRGVLTDGEWRQLKLAVLSNTQNSALTWELEKKE